MDAAAASDLVDHHPFAAAPGRERSGLRAYQLAAVAALACLVALPFQGSRGLFESSEGRYALVAQEMIHTGDWLHPTIDGEQHWTKPPLAYWIIAGGMRCFGENAWGARLPAVLAHAFMAAGAAAIGTRLLGARVGGWSGVFVAVGWLPLAAANAVTTDIYLACFETMAMAAFISSLAAPPASRTARGWLFAMWLAFGLAFLTKGPPALLPLLAVVYWRWTISPRARPRVWTPEGVLLFGVVGLSWFAFVTAHQAGLLAYFLEVEVWGRLTGVTGRNPQWWKGLVIYLPFLAVAAGPLPVVAAGLAFRRRCSLPGPAPAGNGRTTRLLTCWLVLPLTVFLAVPSKLALYVSPCAIPVTLLAVAFVVPRVQRTTLVALAAVTAMVVLGARAWSARQPSRDDMLALANQVESVRTTPALGGAPVVLATTRPLLGLQFYLGEHLERPPQNCATDDVTTYAAALVHRAADTGQCPAVIIVCRATDAPRVLAAVQAAAVATETTSGRFWDVIVAHLPVES